MPEVGQGYEINLNGWCMPYVLNPQSVWQFYYAYLLNLLQFLIADLNIFILFRFVRDEPGFIRGNSITGATVDMPVMLARFGHCFGKVALVYYTVRSQFCRFRKLLIARRIRRFGSRV
jgi:hypothetical protein